MIIAPKERIWRIPNLTFIGVLPCYNVENTPTFRDENKSLVWPIYSADIPHRRSMEDKDNPFHACHDQNMVLLDYGHSSDAMGIQT